jgi:hypothetical protein
MCACSACGGEERRTQDVGLGNLRERDNLGDPGVIGRMILRLILYPAFLAILLVTGSIGGDGDDRKVNAKSKLQKTASFTEVKPLNVHQSTHTSC